MPIRKFASTPLVKPAVGDGVPPPEHARNLRPIRVPEAQLACTVSESSASLRRNSQPFPLQRRHHCCAPASFSSAGNPATQPSLSTGGSARRLGGLGPGEPARFIDSQ